MGGLREGRTLALAHPIQPPAASTAHHVGHPPYGHSALVDVVVAGEDHVHLVPPEYPFQFLPHPPIAAVPRGTVWGPVQERDLPALAGGGQVFLQEGLLPLR